MIVTSGGYTFDFQDALAAFVFDENNIALATYHGAPMKAIDLIVELTNSYLFVEVKHYENLNDFLMNNNDNAESIKRKMDYQTWLKNYLKYKFRDTYLYRHAEGKVEKPIYYLCLINFENALNVAINKVLKKELPVGIPTPRWQKKLCESCHILNESSWNMAFPKWPVHKSN